MGPAYVRRNDLFAIGDDTDNGGNKNVFQHVYFIIAIGVALLLFGARVWVLRRRNRPMTDFFAVTSGTYGTPRAAPNHSSAYPYSPYRSSQHDSLTPLPQARVSRRTRVRAADIDEGGRRMGGPDIDDMDHDGKDALPPYDNKGRPPLYVEAVRPATPPPPITEHSHPGADDPFQDRDVYNGSHSELPSAEGGPYPPTHPASTS